MEKELLPLLCNGLQCCYHLRTRKDSIIGEAKGSIVDEGVHESTVMEIRGVEGHSFRD